VRLTIDAPSSIPVDREEIRLAKLQEGSVNRPAGATRGGVTRLALRRMRGDSVIIGSGRDEVRMTVHGLVNLGGAHPQAQLAFEAPRSVPIDREEIRLAKLAKDRALTTAR